MTKVKIKFKKTYKDTTLPKKAHSSDAGMDLYAYIETTVAFRERVLFPGEWCLIDCGFSMSMPEGWEAQIRPRSGLAYKHGITVLNSPGTIDRSFTGKIKVILYNHGTEEFVVRHGDRIAQMVISEIPEIEIEEVDSLDDTDRGTGGFGSSGV